jgi:hypothetical protein
MPALNPLTGLGGLNPFGGAPVSVPVVAYSSLPNGGASVVQTVTGSTSVNGPASYTLTFASSQVGSALVVFVTVNASAGAALGATPAGWTLVWSQAVATLATGCYVYYNNPGAITSFTLSSPTATTGGIAGVGYEVQNAPFSADTFLSANGSSTTPASNASQLVPPATNNIILGAIGWVAGAVTLTFGNTTPAGTLTTAQGARTVSTVGTTNAAIQAVYFIQPAMASIASTGFITSGTLSGAVVWEAGILNLRTLASDYSVGSADQNAETPGFSVIAGGQQAISVGKL